MDLRRAKKVHLLVVVSVRMREPGPRDAVGNRQLTFLRAEVEGWPPSSEDCMKQGNEGSRGAHTKGETHEVRRLGWHLAQKLILWNVST